MPTLDEMVEVGILYERIKFLKENVARRVPNQTPSSWAYARLASVITGGGARKVDKKIWDKFKL